MTALLILALDCERVSADPARWSLAGTDSVLLRRGDECKSTRDERALEIALGDPRMSSNHARLIRIGERWIVEDRGSKNGTIINGRPLVRAALNDGDLIEVGRMLLVYREVAQTEVGDLDRRTLARGPRALRTLSVALERAYAKLTELARSPRPLAIHVAPGTSAQPLARAVHELAKKRGKLVVQPASRLDLSRAPASGTLVVDGVLELGSAQRRELARLAKSKPELRIVATSERPGALFAERSVTIPPLREHREDVGMLVASVLAAADAEYEWAVEPEAARTLFRHDWPGNQRELETTLAAAAARADDGLLRLEHLPDLAVSTLANAPDDDVKDELCTLLARNRGNVSAVARALGRDRSNVRRLLRRLKIDPRAYR
jgi:hypothetical protein